MEPAKQSDEKTWSFNVNGNAVNVKASAELSLLTALRDAQRTPNVRVE
jgi:aerobic-type carbon monoxide dehydrogenase small subunit (CoxS/CutS family)